MSIKDNMKQAFSELKDSVVPGGGSGNAGGSQTAQQQVPQSQPQQHPAGMTEDGTEVTIVPAVPVREAPAIPFERPVTRRVTTTIISEDTTILGNVTTGGNLEIHGALRGDIDAKGDISIDGGKVLGNLNGCSIQLSGATVQGDLAASGGVALDASSVIMGDVEAESASVDGRIRGNLRTVQGAHLRGNSVLVGNLEARTFSISEGAKIFGSISIDRDNVDAYVFNDLEIK